MRGALEFPRQGGALEFPPRQGGALEFPKHGVRGIGLDDEDDDDDAMSLCFFFVSEY